LLDCEFERFLQENIAFLGVSRVFLGDLLNDFAKRLLHFLILTQLRVVGGKSPERV
jgi:hypothetical protein